MPASDKENYTVKKISGAHSREVKYFFDSKDKKTVLSIVCDGFEANNKKTPGHNRFNSKIKINNDDITAQIQGDIIVFPEGKNRWKEISQKTRIRVFEEVLSIYSRSGRDEGSDFKTSAIILTNKDNLFISSNMDLKSDGGFHKACAETGALQHAKRAEGDSLESIKELHVFGGFPCGVCCDALKPYVDKDTKFIIYPSKADDKTLIINDRSQMNNNSILVIDGLDLMPQTHITLGRPAISVYKNATKELLKGEMPEMKIIDTDDRKPLKRNAELHEINEFLRDTIIIAHNSRPIMNLNVDNSRDVEKVQACVVRTADGKFYHSSRTKGNNDKAASDVVTQAVLSSEEMHRPVTDAYVMEVSLNEKDTGLSVSFEGLERAGKRAAKPNRNVTDIANKKIEGKVNMHYLPFNLIGIGEKNIDEKKAHALNKQIQSIENKVGSDKLFPSNWVGVDKIR